MSSINWSSEEQKQYEWDFAKEKLIGINNLLINGSKISRKEYSELSHSFIVIDDQILAVAEKGVYLGEGANAHAKLAENEAGKLFALKIITKNTDNWSDWESKVAMDLGIAGYSVTRINTLTKVRKYYIAYQYLGKLLLNYILNNPSRSLDECYELCIKASLALYKIHTGIKSIRNQSYIHGDIHWGNILIDDDKNVHIIDFDKTRTLNSLNQNFNSDIGRMLRLFFVPSDYRNSEVDTDWIFGGYLGDEGIFYSNPQKNVDFNRIYIYSEPCDKNEKGSSSQIHYGVLDLNGELKTGVIQLNTLGLEDITFKSSLFKSGFYSRSQDLELIKAEVKRNLIKDEYIRNPLTINTFLLNFFQKCYELEKNYLPLPSALEIAETLTLCRFGLEDFQDELKNLSSKKRLTNVELLNSLHVELKNLYKKLAYLEINKLKLIKYRLVVKLIPSLKLEDLKPLNSWLDTLAAEESMLIKKLLHTFYEKLELENNNLKIKTKNYLDSKKKIEVKNFKEQNNPRICLQDIEKPSPPSGQNILIIRKKKDDVKNTLKDLEVKKDSENSITSLQNKDNQEALREQNNLIFQGEKQQNNQQKVTDQKKQSKESEPENQIFQESNNQSLLKKEHLDKNSDATINQINNGLDVANKPNMSPSATLCNILNILIKNIEMMKNGRWTSGIDSTKVLLLKNVKKSLVTNIELNKDSEDYQNYLKQIMYICELKRNVLHFWHPPHSLKEYKNLLEENNINIISKLKPIP